MALAPSNQEIIAIGNRIGLDREAQLAGRGARGLDRAGRYVASHYFRAAQRGPADDVRDGWLIHDTYAGTGRRFDTLSECYNWAAKSLADESYAAERGPCTLDVAEHHLRADGFRRHLGREIRLTWPGTAYALSLAVVVDDETWTARTWFILNRAGITLTEDCP